MSRFFGALRSRSGADAVRRLAKMQARDGVDGMLNVVKVRRGRRYVKATIGIFLTGGFLTYAFAIAATEAGFFDGSENVFIPLPLTTKMVKQPPYRGSDPEWIEFIRVSKDKELQTAVREKLAAIVLREASHAANILRHAGGGPFSPRRYWMDIDYPYMPPPLYLQSGLSFTPEGKPTIRPRVVERSYSKFMEQTLWPSAVASSVWTIGWASVKMKFNSMAEYLGFESSEPNKQPRTTRNNPRVQAMFEKWAENEKRKDLATRQPDQVRNSDVVSRLPDKVGTSTQSPAGAGKSSPGSDEAKKPMALSLASAHMSVHATLQAVKEKYQRWRRPLLNFPPRGSIMVSGLVELEGPKAWLTFDVIGWFNPKTNNYDMNCLHVSLRRVQKKQQSPAR